MSAENKFNSSLPVLLGVMGDPIAHSKSPAMHNAALQAAGVHGMYMPLHVQPDQLEAAIRGIVALGYRGVNVTIPHKEQVMQYLDVIDDSARLIGAVNTIVNENGKLTGYNTDGIGYVRSLKEEAVPQLEGKRIAVLGAGGAARGVIYALALEKPEQISILNRTADRALTLATDLRSHGLGNISGNGMQDARAVLATADIVINTTAAGMHPHVDDVPVDPAWIREGAAVSDLIYNPLETRLLRESRLRGCTVHGGLGMFVYQGAVAFEHWLGIPAPVDTMRRAVLDSFEK
ncbi:shikimate dehydrogenase [Paenibacillus intestini]|uniref:Shikimate dehydrogenase (NADP(+)) n=1 Tax=Paenibacillus cucumis (ex Kampfer et al. 2016) TaxID=1776858 RepID=A0ABS7KJC9_9BACL|nr:shikimate dehydrogenase [Paenibacillus cucumis (ex Kampfer et al. 2016)]MBY0204253.1 shikimate dehydrogenase [Paenibacillus cucumis (ex Kampfer et al. 2016)]MDP9699320.1 shikimate dehydrogenase [Paenibacillus intestini]